MVIDTLNRVAPETDDFYYRCLDDGRVQDALVICNPPHAICYSPVLLHSRKTLEEHIREVNERKIKKALVVAENINFLRQCPSLEYLWIIPALTSSDFDYSPLYDMPNIRWIRCETAYGVRDTLHAEVDYSRIKGLQSIWACGSSGHQHIEKVETLKILSLQGGMPKRSDLRDVFHGDALEMLTVFQSPITSMEGLDKCKCLRGISLDSNRKLSDISALKAVRDSLEYLEIDNCGKIQDFTVLNQMKHLRHLILHGSNSVDNLSFLNNMPDLEYFDLKMNVLDGDLNMCMRLAHVRIQNRKHYSHKDKELPKNHVKDWIVKLD